MEAIVILIWLISGIAAAFFARRRGASGFVWFMLGFLFGPLGLACSFFAGSYKALIPLGIVLIPVVGLIVWNVAWSVYDEQGKMDQQRAKAEDTASRLAWTEAKWTATRIDRDLESLSYDPTSVQIIGQNTYRVTLRSTARIFVCNGNNAHMDCATK